MSVDAVCSQAQAQRTADGMAPTATLLSAASRTDIPAAPSQIIILSPPQHAARQNESVQGSVSARTSSSSGSPSPNLDGTANPSQPSQPEGASAIAPSGSTSPTQEVDPQIMEALKSKDRLYVLKQAELIEGLICERTPRRLELTASSSYQRLLIHRCSAYYKVQPDTESGAKAIHVSLTPDSRIPGKRIAELVPAEPDVQPTFKIMRRSPLDRRKTQSQAGSVAGEEPDLSDFGDASEGGSVGGRSNATSNGKRHMTIEEREAAYNEARTRIFMDFEEKERMASSSSAISSSASASGGLGSSLGDYDESGGSPPTESEWSAPSGSRKDGRRNNSSRSIRGPYNAVGSSRNSRAPSPSQSFQYATLYEQPATNGFEGSVPPYNGTQYYIPFPTHHAFQPYPFYPPYAQFHPPPPMVEEGQNGNEAMTHQQGPYPTPYVWPPAQAPMAPPPLPPMAMQPSHSNSSTLSNAEHSAQANPTYPAPYVPVFYPGMGYSQFPPPPPPMAPPAMMQPQLYEPSSINGHGANGRSTGNSSSNSRSSSRSSHNGGKGRNARNWTYGPGAGAHGYNQWNGSNGDAYGPRLSGAMRRQSSHSSHSSLGQSRSSDEVSSVASSSTSSSSRRTYTSTASSQPPHPLPARPDWAVGLKPEPTLHATGSARVQPRPVPVLQPQDFPPLTTQAVTPVERRAPVGGAWASPSSTRSVIMPSKRAEDERVGGMGKEADDVSAGLAGKMATASLEDGAPSS
ncbi:hypothetical protein HDZ31DRAFT_65211 [Schizophyllum fasciatum]